MTGSDRLFIRWNVAALLVVLCCGCGEQATNPAESPNAKAAATSTVQPGSSDVYADIRRFGNEADLKPASIYSDRCGAADSEDWISPAASWKIGEHEIGETLEASGFKDKVSCDAQGGCGVVDSNSVRFVFDQAELISIEVLRAPVVSNVSLPLDLQLGSDLDDVIKRLEDAKMGPWTASSNKLGTTTVSSNFALLSEACWQYWIALTFEDGKLVSLKLNSPIS